MLLLFFFLTTCLQGQNTNQKDFDSLKTSSNWHLQFEDDCTKDWKSHWFLDGLRAVIKNTREGMTFSAGPKEGSDASHAVLWTKKSFKGDVKIEYQYTRTDTCTEWVTILYIQATGIPPYSQDISTWNDARTIPAMLTYFTNMKALHISYSAYDKDNTDITNDYIRVRQYPVLPGQNFNTTTAIPEASFKTGLFKPGETYTITVIKTAEKLYFKVEGKKDSKLFSWDLSKQLPILEGRIGLRHMFTRSARYKDFKISVKE
ncbi:DUF1961 family protein [Flavobacterium cellulosilyticum]|uniref:DUF1961 family protein n=1 Tax=Flavobacterium cellulosilyticum TaxID=2541731 RepID=A0A4R5CGA4_9FLAO|nr:DUF1961 family protein [Flavobacterium cellulosilyticum]